MTKLIVTFAILRMRLKTLSCVIFLEDINSIFRLSFVSRYKSPNSLNKSYKIKGWKRRSMDEDYAPINY